MPFWVYQRKGAVHDEIEAITAAYRAGTMDAKTAWLKLSEIYKTVHGHYPEHREWVDGEWTVITDPIKNYELHSKGHGSPVDYMITFWFPMYANMWASDRPRIEMEKTARMLESKYSNTEFAVGYEY
ncbi:MAG: hypothetical protein ACE5NL_01305 [Candidatus Hydrothermarchaeaceae archaeon]